MELEIHIGFKFFRDRPSKLPGVFGYNIVAITNGQQNPRPPATIDVARDGSGTDDKAALIKGLDTLLAQELIGGLINTVRIYSRDEFLVNGFNQDMFRWPRPEVNWIGHDGNPIEYRPEWENFLDFVHINRIRFEAFYVEDNPTLQILDEIMEARKRAIRGLPRIARRLPRRVRRVGP